MGIWRKALDYLGLVEEDRIEAEEPLPVVPAPARRAAPPQPIEPSVRTFPTGSTVPGRRVEPPTPGRWRPTHAEARVDRIGGAVGDARAEVVLAYEFSDAQRIADLLRNRNPVVLDLRATEPEMVRRLVDFASGVTYCLNGHMQRLAAGVVLVLPAEGFLTDEDRTRLTQLGLVEERR